MIERAELSGIECRRIERTNGAGAGSPWHFLLATRAWPFLESAASTRGRRGPESARLRQARRSRDDTREAPVQFSKVNSMCRTIVVQALFKRASALFHSACAVLLMLVAVRACAGTVTLEWDQVNSPSLAGYMLYYGTAAGNYTSKVDVGNTNIRSIGSLADGGTYHFAVTAYDASHNESGFSNDVTATASSGVPVANFTASATSGVAPLALNFTSTSTGSVTTYAWTFGDGMTSTTQNPSHVYSAAGSYTVGLTVTGSGGSNTKTMSNYITVTAAPPGDTTPPSVPGSLVATMSGNTTVNLAWNPSSDNVGVVGYRIERCGGTCSAYLQMGTSSTTNFTDSSLVAGTTYSYRVRAADAAGNLSGYSNTATVTAPGGTASPPVASFNATPTSGNAPLAVNFTSGSTGSITTYAWTFGDGSTSTAQNPGHTYMAGGRYTVTLTVTGPGGTNRKTYKNYVSVSGSNGSGPGHHH